MNKLLSTAEFEDVGGRNRLITGAVYECECQFCGDSFEGSEFDYVCNACDLKEPSDELFDVYCLDGSRDNQRFAVASVLEAMHFAAMTRETVEVIHDDVFRIGGCEFNRQHEDDFNPALPRLSEVYFTPEQLVIGLRKGPFESGRNFLPAADVAGRSQPRRSRIGCAVCKKQLGKFQYAKVGLCNICRRIAANRIGVKKNQVDLMDVPHASPYGNLTDEQRDAFLSGKEY